MSSQSKPRMPPRKRSASPPTRPTVMKIAKPSQLQDQPAPLRSPTKAMKLLLKAVKTAKAAKTFEKAVKQATQEDPQLAMTVVSQVERNLGILEQEWPAPTYADVESTAQNVGTYPGESQTLMVNSNVGALTYNWMPRDHPEDLTASGEDKFVDVKPMHPRTPRLWM